MKYLTIRQATRIAAVSLISSVAFGTVAQAAGEVNIYSYRQPVLIEPMLKEFTNKTGIKANVIYAKKGLAERIKAEGANSPADLIFTVDIGRLTGAKDAGVTQKVKNDKVNANIPANLRDPDGHWFGLTERARVILASKDRVKQDTITYEELSDPKWKGKICTRDGQHVYNIALIASMIANHGEKKAEEWLNGVKSNLARKPAGNDRAQAKGVHSGECDLAVANHYYMALMMTNDKQPEQKEWAKSVKVLWPNTDARGVHVNLSGMAMAKNAPNKDNAIKLMEFLSSDDGQKLYAQVNNEYPVKPGVPAGKIADSLGKFKPDPLPLDKIAAQRKKASEMVDRVGYNNGPSS